MEDFKFAPKPKNDPFGSGQDDSGPFNFAPPIRYPGFDTLAAPSPMAVDPFCGLGSGDSTLVKSSRADLENFTFAPQLKKQADAFGEPVGGASVDKLPQQGDEVWLHDRLMTLLKPLKPIGSGMFEFFASYIDPVNGYQETSGLLQLSDLKSPEDREPQSKAAGTEEPGSFRKGSSDSVKRRTFFRGDSIPLGNNRKAKLIDFERIGRKFKLDLSFEGRDVTVFV